MEKYMDIDLYTPVACLQILKVSLCSRVTSELIASQIGIMRWENIVAGQWVFHADPLILEMIVIGIIGITEHVSAELMKR